MDSTSAQIVFNEKLMPLSNSTVNKSTRFSCKSLRSLTDPPWFGVLTKCTVFAYSPWCVQTVYLFTPPSTEHEEKKHCVVRFTLKIIYDQRIKNHAITTAHSPASSFGLRSKWETTFCKLQMYKESVFADIKSWIMSISILNCIKLVSFLIEDDVASWWPFQNFYTFSVF